MKPCKKHAMLLLRSANSFSKRPLGAAMLPNLAMGLRKNSQSKVGQLLAPVLRQLLRTSMIVMTAIPVKSRTASMLNPFQEQQKLSQSHLFLPLITDPSLP